MLLVMQFKTELLLTLNIVSAVNVIAVENLKEDQSGLCYVKVKVKKTLSYINCTEK